MPNPAARLLVEIVGDRSMWTRFVEAGVKSVTSASIETTNVDRQLQKHNADAAQLDHDSSVIHDDRCLLEI